MKITTFRTIKLITMLLLLSMIGCSSVINKKKFHNSDYTRKRVNGIYKYLTIKYRSNKGIVNLSNTIISFNKERIDKTIESAINDRIVKPKIKILSNENLEQTHIINYIKNIQQLTSDSIAILSRTNKYIQNLTNIREPLLYNQSNINQNK